MNFTSLVLATSYGSAAAFSFDRIIELAPEIWVAMAQTFAMLLVSIPIAILLGTPLGIWLYSMSPNGLRPRPRLTGSWTGWSIRSDLSRS